MPLQPADIPDPTRRWPAGVAETLACSPAFLAAGAWALAGWPDGVVAVWHLSALGIAGWAGWRVAREPVGVPQRGHVLVVWSAVVALMVLATILAATGAPLLLIGGAGLITAMAALGAFARFCRVDIVAASLMLPPAIIHAILSLGALGG
jgi:FtsH-binding integral membrane protein